MAFSLWSEIEDIVVLLEQGAADESVTTKNQDDAAAKVLRLVDLTKRRTNSAGTGTDSGFDKPLGERLQSVMDTLQIDASYRAEEEVVQYFTDDTTDSSEMDKLDEPVALDVSLTDVQTVSDGTSTAVEPDSSTLQETLSTSDADVKSATSTFDSLYDRPVVVRGFLAHQHAEESEPGPIDAESSPDAHTSTVDATQGTPIANVQPTSLAVVEPLLPEATKSSDSELLSAWHSGTAHLAMLRMAQGEPAREPGPSSVAVGFSEAIAQAYQKYQRKLDDSISVNVDIVESDPDIRTVAEVQVTNKEESQEHKLGVPELQTSSRQFDDGSQEIVSKQNLDIFQNGTNSSPGRDLRQIDQIKYRYVVGKRSGKDILSSTGDIIIGKYQVITEQAIDLAEREGKLVELIVNMVIEGYGD